MAYQSNIAFDELCAFVAVVDARGFSAAARTTGGRKATLSRRVQDLEARLGLPLLMRTTRSLRLTAEGEAYYALAVRSLTAARDAEAAVLAARAEPNGTLRVTTSAAMVDGVLSHVATKYLARYPRVSLIIETSDARSDLVRDGFDVAVRLGALGDSSMLARRLGVMRGGYFASPRYLRQRGEPERPEQLREHDLIVIPKGDGPQQWRFAFEGKLRHVQLQPRLTVTSLDLATKAAVAGAGIVRAPLPHAEPYLRKQQLVPILEKWTLAGVDVHAVFPPGGGLVPKTRAFIDMLSRWLGPTTMPRAR
jgi:LysR family transcriptional regulator, regulator for bpeEF and oprC